MQRQHQQPRHTPHTLAHTHHSHSYPLNGTQSRWKKATLVKAKLSGKLTVIDGIINNTIQKTRIINIII